MKLSLFMFVALLSCGIATADDLYVTGSLHATDVIATRTLSGVGCAVTTVTATKGAIFNDEMGSSNHFTVKGRGNARLLYVDTYYDRVGIFTGTDVPAVKLDVRGYTRVNGDLNVSSTSTAGTPLIKANVAEHKLGIGTSSPSERLDVNGALRLRDVSTTISATPSNSVILYSYGGHLYARDIDHNHTLTSPHRDPREIFPGAQTSFDEPGIELPFSFYHKNTLIGKEQVVDMAKLVAWTESKMQNELGESKGRLVYTRDLPAGERITLEQSNEALLSRKMEQVLDKLDSLPWIEVELAADGSVPTEAFEEVPLLETVCKKVLKDMKEIDCRSMKVVTVQREIEVVDQVNTGKTQRQLRADWRFTDGKLYRRPTAKDIDLDALLQDCPQLSPWVLDRIKAGKQTSMDIKTLTDKIRKILAAGNTEPATRQSALN